MAGTAVLLLMALTLNEGDASISSTSVNCLIINLEYINCTWTAQGIQEVNYTFHRLERSTYTECPSYLLQNELTVGCRLPYTSTLKFNRFHTRLAWDKSSSELEQIIDLRHLVKLDPPHHLRLEMREGESNPELWLHWSVSCPSTCVESQVRYRKQGSNCWKETLPIEGYSFIPPFFSPDDIYRFQVRIRVPEQCVQSKYWSEWSTPAVWGSKPRSIIAGFHPRRLGPAAYWLTLAVVVLALIG
ncbi:cytokine receptor common subunit gamma-like isoform X1 [Anguilla anguilla]|uniref:cytokine receptor common subunit gamma-like isoform X1 n=1 Tax=Anguilla anguilla TaxID=7936 RepID=UPI0015AC830F|nr:cytokine receptor common subunit gamma-like isoform X1 [Anguilla anguilla]